MSKLKTTPTRKPAAGGFNARAGMPAPRAEAKPRVTLTGQVRQQRYPLFQVFAAGVLVEITDVHGLAADAFTRTSTYPKLLQRTDYLDARPVLLQAEGRVG